ncbi:MAG: ABC transporter ATP-binding protein [Thermaerobacter sp.]
MTGTLRIVRLSKTYPGGTRALGDVSLTIRCGSLTALLGPNGAGKTTLVNCLLGLVRPDAGQVLWNDEDLLARPQRARDVIGVVFEEVHNIYGYLTVRENIQYFAALNGISPKAAGSLLAQWLPRFDLDHKAGEVGFNLSRGMRQKTALILAMIKDPPVLVLDEPTLGLDIASRRRMIQWVRQMVVEQDKAVLLTTHDAALAEELADRYAFIRGGSIVWEGTREDLAAAAGAAADGSAGAGAGAGGLEAAYRRIIGGSGAES